MNNNDIKNKLGINKEDKDGENFFHYFKEIGELKSYEKVLDIGSGKGRMALPLIDYLDSTAIYEGIDIIKTEVERCKKNISIQYPNFHFQHSDIFNGVYNPNGHIKASEYKFPFENEYFDFVFLTSVFTHMLPQDVINYFSEISRVLKRGGRVLTTFFLLNAGSSQLTNTLKGIRKFEHKHKEYQTDDSGRHEVAVCYNEPFILELYKKVGLKVQYPIHYGSWCGRLNFLDSQDIVVALKS